MKQKFYKTLSLRFNAEVTKMLIIDFKKTMIVDVMSRKTKMTTT